MQGAPGRSGPVMSAGEIYHTHAAKPGQQLRYWVVLPLALHLLVLLAGYLIRGRAPFGGFSDEAFVLVMLAAAIVRILREGILKRAAIVAAAGAAIFIIGFISDLANPELTGLPVWRGAIIAASIDLKIYILVFCYIVLFHSEDRGSVENAVALICKAVIIYSLINLVLSFADTIRGIGLHNQILETRAGLLVPQGLFDHKFKTAFTHFIGFASAMALIGAGRHRWLYGALAGLFFLGLVQTASVKELIGALVILPLFVAFQPVIIARIGFFLLAPVVIFLLGTSDNRISRAIGERMDMFVAQDAPQTVRGTLYARAPEVAADYFPLGSGWATFGSSASRDVFYSPLYYIYGIAFTHGGTESDGSFLVDTFWPKILAELGFFGAALYGALWVAGLVAILRRWQTHHSSLAFRFAVFVFAGELAISLATPVYNYADGAIFGALSLALLLGAGAGTPVSERRAVTRAPLAP